MTSGEWDLRALKALEEEEQAQFRAISESNLFKTSLPPPPPPAATAPPPSASSSSTSSNQQPPQIILPTINEHCGDLDDGLDVPPLPLTLFRSSDVAASTLSLGRKKKPSSSASALSASSSIPTQPFLLSLSSSGSAKPTGTFSPPQFTASPIFTPPPIRRCATLSHSGGPAVRRHFRSLHHQILGKKSAASGGGGLERRRSRSNYNCNYTSCTGGSGDSGSPATVGNCGLGLSGSLSDNNDYDSTDSGSCTVPLTKDSIEMMRLMLFSATSSKSNSPEIPPSIASASASSSLSATGGVGGIGGGFSGGLGLGSSRPLKISSLIHDDSCIDDDILTNGNCNSAGVKRRQQHHHQQQQQQKQQQQQRHKSFLSFTGCDSFGGGGSGGRSGGSSSNSSATGGGSIMGITCRIRKSPTKSLLMSGCAIELDASTLNPTRTSDQDSDFMEPTLAATSSSSGPSAKGQLQLLLDEDSSGIRTANHFNDLVKSIQSTKSTGIATATDAAGPPSSLQQQQQQQQHHHQHQHPCSAMFDHELEHHIKHCSCSCNHMGYGNSMDYQTTGFGGLPDVTEHSNIRRSISRQNSISNSDSIEISSIQKTKGLTIKSNTSRQSKNQNDIQGHASAKRNFCIYSLSLMAALALSLVAAMLAYQHFLMAPSRNSHEQRLRIVRRILRDVPLVDGHNDFPWNVRKYAHSSLELVELSHDMDHKSMWNRPAWSQTDITRLRQGLVGVQVWSAHVPCEAQGLDAVQLALEQIDIIHRLTDMYPKDTALVTSYQEILTVRRQGLMASMIGIEGGHAIGSSLGVLRSFHSLGARYLSLTHKCDIPWAGSSASPFEMGLTTFGKAVVKEMNRLGMMIDLSQSSDETARDVFQVTRAPVIFSHSAARQLCNSTRNIPDDVLRLVADNGGLIMISFDSEVVSCGRTSTLLDVVAHIKYIRSIAGIQHIGIGAGYDGIEQPPVGLENVSKYPDLLATLLEDNNWSEEDIAMLAGKNFLRVLKSVENVRDYWKRAAIPPGEVSEQLPKTHCTYMSS